MFCSSLFGGSGSRGHKKIKNKLEGEQLLPNTGGRKWKPMKSSLTKHEFICKWCQKDDKLLKFMTVCYWRHPKPDTNPPKAESWTRICVFVNMIPYLICCLSLSPLLVVLSPLHVDLNLWYKTNNYGNFNLCIIYSQGGEAGHLLLYRRGAVHALPRTSSPTLFKVQSLLGIKHISEIVSQDYYCLEVAL